MAYYAILNKENVVIEVITGKEMGEDGINWEEWYGNFRGMKCKRTSYNTHGNIHSLDKTPFRGNFAGIGYIYDAALDAFIPPCPGDGYELDKSTFTWRQNDKYRAE